MKNPISAQISALMLVMLLLISTVSLVSSYFFLWPDFQKVEEEDASQNRDRIRNIFFDEIASLHQLAHDWSSSDSTYAYIQHLPSGPTESYLEENFNKSVLWNKNIDVIALVNTQREIVWAREFNSDSGKLVNLSEEMSGFVKKNNPFSQAGKYGLYVDENRIFLSSTRPIFNSFDKGPRTGYITLMRRVDDDFINSFNLEFATDMSMKVHQQNVPSLKSLKKNDGWGQEVLEDSRISFFNISAMNSGYSIGFYVRSDRAITEKAYTALLWNGAVIVAGSAALLLILLYALNKIVARPLREMSHKILAIGQDEDGAEVDDLDESRDDELGLISHEINRMHKRIRELALVDHLTQLPNRRLFEDRMASALDRAQRENRHVALLFLDLNGFKQVNDTLGHQAGDELLVRVARRLRAMTRASDSLARLGGDEFGLIMEINADDHAESVECVCKKIVDTLLRPFKIGDDEVNISTSIGISIYPDNCDNADDMISYADKAMYRAKKDKSLYWQFYDPVYDPTDEG